MDRQSVGINVCFSFSTNFYIPYLPVLFSPFSNFIMVPLSSLILFVEIFLVGLSWIPPVARCTGYLIWVLVWLMNKIILWFNHLPFAVWDKISATVTSTILLYCIVIFIAIWLMDKSKNAFRLTLCGLFAFLVLNGYTKWNSIHQQIMIVYNVPQH